jgi:hypothetical protein
MRTHIWFDFYSDQEQATPIDASCPDMLKALIAKYLTSGTGFRVGFVLGTVGGMLDPAFQALASSAPENVIGGLIRFPVLLCIASLVYGGLAGWLLAGVFWLLRTLVKLFFVGQLPDDPTSDAWSDIDG